jgi:hypothetical protein
MTATAAFGTAQVPNKLILDGKEVPLFGNPLDSWLEKNPPKPEFCHDEIISSNNWRGYQATWKISGDRLLLLEVAKMHSVPKWRSWLSDNGYEYRAVPVEWYMPGKKLPVFAEWYSGRLMIPQGKMTRYVHMGYASSTRGAAHEIKNGVVVRACVDYQRGQERFRSNPISNGVPRAAGRGQGRLGRREVFATRRVRALIKSGEEFRTRGVSSVARIRVCLLRWSSSRRSGRCGQFSDPQVAAGSRGEGRFTVEVTARFVVVGEVPELHVSAIRELKGGESMHAASFPAEWEKLQAEAAAEKAAEATKATAPAKAE